MCTLLTHVLTPRADLVGLQHAAMLDKGPGSDAVIDYTTRIRAIMHALMVTGKGTRDLCGAAGLTTEEFVDEVRTVQRGWDIPTLSTQEYY